MKKYYIDQAHRFIRLAEKDVSAFRVLIDDKNIDCTMAFFHAQQAVEKFLKAVIILHGIDPTRTHDLTKLYEILGEIGLNEPLNVKEVSKLTPYAVMFRYDENEVQFVTKDQAINIVNIVAEWAKKTIKEEI